MRAREHAAARVPAGAVGSVASVGTAAALRRSGALALAAFAALLTLVLPAPAVARPASTNGGAVATTGLGATSGSSAGRRTHRADVARSSRSHGASTTVSAPTSGHVAEVNAPAPVTGVSHTGPVLTAALPATVRATPAVQAAGGSARAPGSSGDTGAGAHGSRAPPAL